MTVGREAMLARIRSNIDRYGHHLYVVDGKPVPRFAYTIGLSTAKGAELTLVGAAAFSITEVQRIITTFASTQEHPSVGLAIPIDSLGTFSLGSVDPTWASMLILGAMDYYGTKDVPTLQILPDHDHTTIDVPDLARPWDPVSEPAWAWLREPWEHGVSDRSVAITNLAALQGKRVTEVMRWEEDQWELFAGAGPDVAERDVRKVPLGTLLSVDPSLNAVTRLEVGKGLWRDPTQLVWHDWGR